LSERKIKLPRVYWWLKKNQHVYKKGHHKSHTVMDGPVVGFGPIHITDQDDIEDLYREIGRTAKASEQGLGGPMFIIEYPITDQPYPLYFDLDIYINKLPGVHYTETYVFPIVACLHATVMECYPNLDDARYKCIMISAGIGEKTINKEECVKVGLHLYYNGIPSNANTTMLFRRKAIVALEARYPDRLLPSPDRGGVKTKLQNSFSDIIDVAVAKNPSHRLPYSSKLDFCKCSKEGRDCPPSHFKGRYDAMRREQVLHVLTADGRIDEANTDKYKRDKELLLRHTSFIMGWENKSVMKPDIDESFELGRFGPEEGKGHGPGGGGTGSRTAADGDAANVVTQLLQLYFPDDRPVESVQYDKKNRAYTMRLAGHRCPNKNGGSHNGNGVYLMVNRNGVSRRCFSEGKDNRLICDCQDFEQRMPVPPRLFSTLFGIQYFRKPYKPILQPTSRPDPALVIMGKRNRDEVLDGDHNKFVNGFHKKKRDIITETQNYIDHITKRFMRIEEDAEI
jgi:hypothetical protein